MPRHTDWTRPSELLEQIAEPGLDALPELIRLMINAAMHAERQQQLGAALDERSATRRGYANGYTPKPVTPRVGVMTFDRPQVRRGRY